MINQLALMSGWRPFGNVIVDDAWAQRGGCSHVSGLKRGASRPQALMFYAEPGPSHIIALDWRKTMPRVLQFRRSISALASHHFIVTVPTGMPCGQIV
jgi:hypothetical protein